MANSSVFKKIDEILERINETIDDADVETIEPLEKIRNQWSQRNLYIQTMNLITDFEISLFLTIQWTLSVSARMCQKNPQLHRFFTQGSTKSLLEIAKSLDHIWKDFSKPQKSSSFRKLHHLDLWSIKDQWRSYKNTKKYSKSLGNTIRAEYSAKIKKWSRTKSKSGKWNEWQRVHI